MSPLVHLVRIPIIVAIVFYGLIPTVFWLKPGVMQHVFFLNFVRVPFTNFTDLSKHGVRSLGRNFYINEEEGAGPRLGVWHILPSSISAGLKEKESNGVEHSPDQIERLLDEGSQAIMLYLHGNSFDRTNKHRCELYNVLSEMDFHILAVDYRGYGDSEGWPNEQGVVEDALALYHYARRVAPSKPLYVWGHSMGTGVAVQAVANMASNEHHLDALILEAPFNNLRDVVNGHPFSWPWRHLPFFDAVFVKPLLRSGLVMDSEKHIEQVHCPVLVLHSADDHIIPVELGRRLAEKARKALGMHRVTYMEFDAERRFLHKYIHRAEELPRVVEEFLRGAHLSERSRNRMESAAERSEHGEHLWEREDQGDSDSGEIPKKKEEL